MRRESGNTYLVDLTPSDIEPPLGEFQHSGTTKQESWALLETINAELDRNALDRERLKATFEAWWPQVKGALDEIPEKPQTEDLSDKRSGEGKLDELLSPVRSMPDSESRSPDLSVRRLNQAKMWKHCMRLGLDDEISASVAELMVEMVRAGGSILWANMPYSKATMSVPVQADRIDIDDDGYRLTDEGWHVVRNP